MAASFRSRLGLIAWISLALSRVVRRGVACSDRGVDERTTAWPTCSRRACCGPCCRRPISATTGSHVSSSPALFAGVFVPFLSATGNPTGSGSRRRRSFSPQRSSVAGLRRPRDRRPKASKASFIRLADVLHLIAAAAWVGALVPLALLLAMTEQDAACARRGALPQRCASRRSASSASPRCSSPDSSTAGISSAAFRRSTAAEYGQLLLIKLALFLGMVGIAAVNWSQLTPRLVAERRLPGRTEGAAAIAPQRRNRGVDRRDHHRHRRRAGNAAAGEPRQSPRDRRAPFPADAILQHIHSEHGMADVMIEPGRVGTASVTIHLLNDDLETLNARDVTLTLTAPLAHSKADNALRLARTRTASGMSTESNFPNPATGR